MADHSRSIPPRTASPPQSQNASRQQQDSSSASASATDPTTPSKKSSRTRSASHSQDGTMPVTSHFPEANQVDTIKKQIALPENALILYDFLDKNTLTELHTTAAGLNYTEHNIPNMRHLLSAVAVQKTQQAWRADLEELCATIGRRIHSDQFCKFSAGNYTLIEKVKTHT